ncbi:MAG: acyl-CoA thioester hydrolase/BAAT C-terminal domain-containing protein [Rhizomicrobium sp.]|nr:acyl-CoA thioester hydrolase/BAAT C-terminal domain-containing protein [Rhizomicrobium sp.]
MGCFKRILIGLGIVVVLIVAIGTGGYFYLKNQTKEYVATLQSHGGVEIRQNGLVGRYYAPKGVKHHTAVLMLGGSNGGFPYGAAAANLAEAGYPTFALAYFHDQRGRPADSPPYLANIPLEYFFRALEWMKTQPAINPDKIVLMGESRGGELVLLLGSLRPDVAGVIAYSPSHVLWAGLDPTLGQPAWTLKGKGLPFLKATFKSATEYCDGFKTALATASPKTLAAVSIPVENIHGPVLLISSKTDHLWPASFMSNAAAARLKVHAFPYPVTNLQFDDSSHLLMGFGPGLVKMGIPYVWEMDFGGSAEGTRKARDTGWAASKAFLAEIEASSTSAAPSAPSSPSK